MIFLGVLFFRCLLLGVRETFGICVYKVFDAVRKCSANTSSSIFSHHLLLELNYTYVGPLESPPVTKALVGPPTPRLLLPLCTSLLIFSSAMALRSLIFMSTVSNLLLILFSVFFIADVVLFHLWQFDSFWFLIHLTVFMLLYILECEPLD